jgi:hypothetical protein
MNKAIALVLLICVFMLGSLFVMNMHYDNKDVELRNLVEAKQKDNENIFDSVWKIISQQAQVSTEYKNAFAEIYPDLIAGRYESGGQMMKWIQESNPNFDVSLYKQLMVSIEAQRMRFADNQTTLIDYKREHDNLIGKAPSKWFVPNKEIEITVVTSAKTSEVFSLGEDNEVNLFSKE